MGSLKKKCNPKQGRSRGKKRTKNIWDRQKLNRKMVDLNPTNYINHSK